MSNGKKSSSPPRGSQEPKADASLSLPVIDDKLTIRASKSGPRRAIVLAIIQILMIAHLVQWAITGHTLSPVEPSESMELVRSGTINMGLIFFAVALLSTLILGRWFCGWGCHVIMLQDLCGWMLRRVGIRPKPFRSRVLVYVPFVLALYMFVWPAVYRWGIVPLSAKLHRVAEWIPALHELPAWPGFNVEVTTSDFWHTFPGVLVAIPFLLVCGFATVYFLGNKGFCTYGCPYGGFFAPFEQYAPGRIRVTDACEGCGHCTAVCTSNVRVHDEVREFGMVVDPGCMKCMDCVSVCPNDALYFGFGRPAVSRGEPRHAPPPKNFDLTLWEEAAFAIIFFLVFVSVRGVYTLVPMLMAAGLAGCVTYIAFKLWQVMRLPSTNLHRFRLKYKGALTRAGLVYVLLAVAILGVTAHSGVVNAATSIAERIDGRVTVPRSAIFAAAPMRLPDEMRAEAARALRYYAFADRIGEGGIGLFKHPQTDIRRAWLHACLHEFDEAERLMRRHTRRYGRSDAVCRDIALLMRIQERPHEARAYYDQIFEIEPTFFQTLDGLVTWYESEGNTDAAIERCRRGLEHQPPGSHGRSYLQKRLSLLLMMTGALEESIELFKETIAEGDPSPESIALLAEAYRRSGDMESAIDSLRTATEMAPNDVRLVEAMAELLNEAGRVIEAAEFEARAAELRR